MALHFLNTIGGTDAEASSRDATLDGERVLYAGRPVVFFINGLGDRILTLPALRALASLFAGRLRLICSPGDRDNFYSDLNLEGVCELCAIHTSLGHSFDARSLADRLGVCDILISLNPWHSDSIDELLRLLPNTDTIGFGTQFRYHVPYPRQRHVVDEAFDLPLRLDPALRLSDYAGPPQFPAASVEFARHLRSIVPAGVRVLAVQTETRPEKMWPVGRFMNVLDTFLERHPNFIAWIIEQHNRGLNRVRHGDRVFSMRLPLSAAMALVQMADLFLGVDSCMLHVADLSRIPAVGLFGPSPCHRFGVRFGPHRHIDARGPIDQIDEGSVLAALESLASGTGDAAELR